MISDFGFRISDVGRQHHEYRVFQFLASGVEF